MFSRKLTLTLCGILVFSSCGPFLNGPKSEPKVLDFSNDPRLACLKDFPAFFDRLSEGEITTPDIEISAFCVQKVLGVFRDDTKGSFVDGYSGEDLRKFLRKNYKEENLTPGLMAQVLRLKMALVGGSSDRITKTEITRLSYLTGIAKEEAISLLPFLKLYTMKQSAAHPAVIDQAIYKLKKAGIRFLQEMQFTASQYSIEDADGLFNELVKYFSVTREGSESFKKVQDLWPVILSLSTAVAGEGKLKSADDLEGAILSFIDFYDLALRSQYVAKTDIQGPEDARNLGDMLLKIMTTLEAVPQMKKTSKIPSKQVDAVLESIDKFLKTKEGFNQLPVSTKSIEETYRVVFGRLEQGIGYTTASNIKEIHVQEVQHLINELKVWRSLQDWVDFAAPDSKDKIPWAAVLESMDSFNPNEENLQDSWSDFKSLLSRGQPVQFDDKGRFVVHPNLSSIHATWSSLSRTNVSYMLLRLFLVGYSAKKPVLQERFITEGELTRWYEDFNTLGKELKAFHPYKPAAESGARSFKEINFFTFSGNGNKEADFNEMFEFISMLISAGMVTIEDFRSHIAEFTSSDFPDGCSWPITDDFGYLVFQEKCFEQAMRKNFSNIFSGLPGLVQYVSRPDNWKLFYPAIIEATRMAPTGQKGFIDFDHIRNLVMMTHYLENLFITFDTDQNRILSYEELKTASDRFKEFLNEIRPVPSKLSWMKDTLLTHGFVYLVVEGRPPQGFGDYWDYIWDLTKIRYFSKPLRADRTNIAEVFRNLKDELKKKSD